MKLVASLIVHNERGRYLEVCIQHLLEFCDEVAIVNDGSTDGTAGWLHSLAHKDSRVHSCNTAPRFFQHEGRARQWLIDWTLRCEPTHVVSIDADEMVDNGAALRALIEAAPEVPAWSLDMLECWNAKPDHLEVRVDGGWRPHPLSMMWRAPRNGERWKMLDRKLACRRVPMPVLSVKAKPTGLACLHFGWTDPATRQARYQRYATHDGGRFHASSHLRSILWDDARVRLESRPWPEGVVFDSLRERFGSVAAR